MNSVPRRLTLQSQVTRRRKERKGVEVRRGEGTKVWRWSLGEEKKLKSEGGGHAVRLCFQYTIPSLFQCYFHNFDTVSHWPLVRSVTNMQCCCCMFTISDTSVRGGALFIFLRCSELSLVYKAEAIIIPILKKRKLRLVAIKQYSC